MASDHEYIDVGQVVLDRLGIPLDVYWATSAAVGIAVMGDRQLHVFPKQIGMLPPEVLERWFAIHTQSVGDARRLVAADLAVGSPWALTTFFAKPILQGVGDDGDYPIRPQLLALKATLVGMYYLVFDLLRAEVGDRHLQWSRVFGRCVESYGRRLFQTLLVRPETLRFPDEGRRGPNDPKACDVLVDEGRSLIALDFVHRVLNLATQTSGTPADLERDLELGIVEKIDQVDVTLAAALAGRADVERVFPVIVMSGPLPMSPIAEAHIARLVAVGERRVVGADDRCRPVAVMELHELKMFLRTASENGVSPSDLLEAWLQSSLGANNFRDWLLCQSDVTPGRSQPGEDWEQLVFAIFHPDEGTSAPSN